MLGRAPPSTSAWLHANRCYELILSQRMAAWPTCLAASDPLTASKASMTSLVRGALVACGGMQLVQWLNAWTASGASTPVASKASSSRMESVHVVQIRYSTHPVLFAIKNGRHLTNVVTVPAGQIRRTQASSLSAANASTSTTQAALALKSQSALQDGNALCANPTMVRLHSSVPWSKKFSPSPS